MLQVAQATIEQKLADYMARRDRIEGHMTTCKDLATTKQGYLVTGKEQLAECQGHTACCEATPGNTLGPNGCCEGMS